MMQAPLNQILTTIGSRRSKIATTWSPTALGSTLIQWLKASAGIGVSSGSKFSSWADQSTVGNNASQATSGAQFTYNATSGPGGKPCVTGSGGQQMTCSGSEGVYASSSIFIVSKFAAECSIAGVNGIDRLYMNDSDALLCSYLAGGSSTQQLPATTNYSPGSWQLVEAHMSGSLSEIGVNGTLATTGPAAQAWTPSRIGCGNNYDQINGSIAEVIVTSPAVTTGQRTSVLSYLDAEYAIY